MLLFRPSQYRVSMWLEDAEERNAIAQLLRRDGYQVDVLFSSAQVVQSAEQAPPSLLLLDDRPQAQGIGVEHLPLCHVLRACPPLASVPIILLGSEDPSRRIAGFEEGADDFVARPFSLAELLLRVRARCRESRVVATGQPPSRITNTTFGIDMNRLTADLTGQSVRLTVHELRVLVRLMENQDRVMSRRELAPPGRRWGPAGQRAVDSQIKRLRRKLGAAGERIETVRGEGYRFTS